MDACSLVKIATNQLPGDRTASWYTGAAVCSWGETTAHRPAVRHCSVRAWGGTCAHRPTVRHCPELCFSVTCFCVVAHGHWSPWSAWGACSRTCNGGQMRRYRTCDNPRPSHGGRACGGPDSQVQRCNANMCPGEFCLPGSRLCRALHAACCSVATASDRMAVEVEVLRVWTLKAQFLVLIVDLVPSGWKLGTLAQVEPVLCLLWRR